MTGHDRPSVGSTSSSTQGVGVQRVNRTGFNRPEVYVIDDWR